MCHRAGIKKGGRRGFRPGGLELPASGDVSGDSDGGSGGTRRGWLVLERCGSCVGSVTCARHGGTVARSSRRSPLLGQRRRSPEADKGNSPVSKNIPVAFSTVTFERLRRLIQPEYGKRRG